MKICSQCKQLKQFFDFYKHPSIKDGHRSECKECSKKLDKPRNKNYYQDNIEIKKPIYREYRKFYRKKYPEKVREDYRVYQARKNNQLGKVFPGIEKALFWFQNGKCLYCGCSIREKYHMDHMVPLSRGGLHCWTNVCLACPTCNLSKNDKTAEEFMYVKTKLDSLPRSSTN